MHVEYVELVGPCRWMLVNVNGDDHGLNMLSAARALENECVFLCVYVCGFKQHIFMIVIYVYEIASQHSIRKKWQRGRRV